MVSLSIAEVYDKPLGKDYEYNILKMIKKDIKDIMLNISNEEVEHISKNVYLFCYLKVMNVNDFEVSQYLLYSNNVFYESMEKKGLILNEYTNNVDIQLFKKLSKKYIKILKKKFRK